MIVCPSCREPLSAENHGWRCGGCEAEFAAQNGITDFIGKDDPPIHFEADFLPELAPLENVNFWHVGRKKVILSVFRRFVEPGAVLAEIGCGNASVLKFLAENGYPGLGIEAHMEGIEECRRRLGLDFHRADIRRLPYREEFEAVGLFDVLEHVDDDLQALKNCHEALKPGGVLVATVPAHPFLWGPFDEFSGHRRRYSNKSLRNALRGAGFRVKWMSHFVCLLFPAALARASVDRLTGRKAQDMTIEKELRPIPLLNPIFASAMSLESRLLSKSSLPFGGSLIAAAQKPG